MAGVLINIDVPDLASGIRFYREGLGFVPQRTLFQHTVAELSFERTLLYLIEASAGSTPFPTAQQMRTFNRHWTPVHLDLVVEDINVALERALEAGAVQSGDLQKHSWGSLAPLADPFGHGFCLLQFSAGGYDLVADESEPVSGCHNT